MTTTYKGLKVEKVLDWGEGSFEDLYFNVNLNKNEAKESQMLNLSISLTNKRGVVTEMGMSALPFDFQKLSQEGLVDTKVNLVQEGKTVGEVYLNYAWAQNVNDVTFQSEN
jgi:hypothetical protein